MLNENMNFTSKPQIPYETLIKIETILHDIIPTSNTDTTRKDITVKTNYCDTNCHVATLTNKSAKHYNIRDNQEILVLKTDQETTPDYNQKLREQLCDERVSKQV